MAEDQAPRRGTHRRVDMRIGPRPRLVAEVRQALDALDLPPSVLGDARLLVSEFLSNSIRHAGLAPDEEIRITAWWSGGKLRVDVYDRQTPSDGTSARETMRPEPLAGSGWGLFLVDRISTRWGRMPGRHWFELEEREPGSPED